MKKGLIPFRIIKKYKYIYFICWSVLVSTIAWLLYYVMSDSEYELLSDKSLLLLFALAWLNFPASFVLYNYAEKKEKKKEARYINNKEKNTI